ncbi:MAG: DUF1501 domain-containing protein [Pirellulales bacterium]
MLTIYGQNNSRDCEGLCRRDFIRAGTLGIGGLSLPWLLHHQAMAAVGDADYVRDKAVVLLFLAGGASHIETFNPNMDAPSPYSSVTGEVGTTLPGVTFGGTLPLLARHAKKMAVVRSFMHPVGDHEKAISHVLTGGTDPNGEAKEGFSIGSMYSRLRGSNNPASGLPTYHLLLSPHKDGQYAKELKRVVRGSRPGPLGSTNAAFEPGSGGSAIENMTLNLTVEQLAARRKLLGEINRLRRGLDKPAVADSFTRFEQQAVDLITGGASKAFDLSKEDPRLVERYDTSKFRCGKKVFQPSILGRQMLVARRLVEAGAGFVTVQQAGWDMHADGNNPGMESGMEMLGRPFDKAVATFLEDLEDRGLADKVLLVITGDFGRTPKINKNGGRDHWAKLCTLAFAGGGIRNGQVIGQSDRQNSQPASDPISTPNMLSTIMHVLFDVGRLRVARGAPQDLLKLIEDHDPITQLF